MRTRFLNIIIIIFAFSTSLYPQDKDKQPKKVEKPLLVGGSLGLQFGTITFIDASPKFAYRWTEHFATGIGGSYKYYKDQRFSQNYSTSIYGGRIFAQHDIWNNIYAYGEYEHLQYEGYNLQGNLGWIKSNNILLGAGYKQWLSRSAYSYLMLLYNINETYTTPYSNPVIRAGFLIRL